MGLFSMFGGGGDQAGAAQDAGELLAKYAKEAGELERNYGYQGMGILQQALQNSRGDLSNYYNTAVGELSPYKNTGLNALDQLAQLSGTATPAGGSLNNSYVGQYNTLQQRLAQLSNESADLQAWWMVNQDPALQNERSQREAVIASNNNQAATIKNQIQAMIQNAPPEIKQQLNDNYTKTQDYIKAYNNNKLFPILGNSPGDNSTRTPTVEAILKANGAEVPTGLLDVNNPGLLQLNADTQSQQQTSSNPLGGFAQSAQAALMGGYDANKSLADNFRTDPGYQFALDQGRSQLEKSAASRGLLESGTFAKAMNDYGQGMADQQYDSYLSRLGSSFGNYQNQLMNLAGFGNQASTNIANASMGVGGSLAGVNTNYGNQAAPFVQNIGSNYANSILAQGNALAGGMMNAANINAANSQANSQMGSMLGGVLGKVGGTMIGGPVGGMLGGAFGSAIGGGLF